MALIVELLSVMAEFITSIPSAPSMPTPSFTRASLNTRLDSKAFLVAALVLISGSSAHAWPAKFGAEFTLTNDLLVKADYGPAGDETKSPENSAAQRALIEQISRICQRDRAAKCVIEKEIDRYGVDSYRVTFGDGWWFQVSLDPGVIEIQTKAATLAELKNIESRLQKYIFDAGSSVGLAPHESYGGGHIHIGDEDSFDGNDRLFRNFLADLINHPEVASGVFGRSSANAFPISSLPPHLFKRLPTLLEKFDAGQIKDRYRLVELIHSKVYLPLGFPYPKTLANDALKYRAVNFVRMNPSKFEASIRTLELRARRPQRSAKDFLRQIALLDARLHALNDLNQGNQNIAIQPPKAVHEKLLTADDVERFQRYVTEAGLDFREYQDYVPPELLTKKIVGVSGRIQEATQPLAASATKQSWFARLFPMWSARAQAPLCQDLLAR